MRLIFSDVSGRLMVGKMAEGKMVVAYVTEEDYIIDSFTAVEWREIMQEARRDTSGRLVLNW